jgi:Cys-rich protein (TIGR01571 family)
MGCCHPTVCMACCFPIILLGQVMQRLKLTWLAGVGQNPSQTSSTFRILFSIGITSIILQCLPYILAIVLVDKKGEPSDSNNIFMLAFNLINIVISLFYLVLLCRTRRHIREKYQIPEQQCHGCEDCCCSYWCSCCTLAQMARHTGDYAAHGSRWCSETGMAPGAPSIV